MRPQEYQGAKANGEDDYMCVKIKAEVHNVPIYTRLQTTASPTLQKKLSCSL
jgi:hypothetical protein